MIFVTVCVGEERRSDTMHLLNDLRNLDYKVYLLTNINFDLEKFQFYNVVIVKSDSDSWSDFDRFKVIKHALLSEIDDYIYYLDCDSRFFNFRNEKFNKDKFEFLLSTLDFDIMCPWTLEPIKNQLLPPDKNENKNVRNFKFGFDSLIEYFKQKNKNYYDDIEKGSYLETLLIFRRSDKLILYIDEMLNIFNRLVDEEKKINRVNFGCACGFAMTLMSSVYDINVIQNKIVYHFFKGNFLNEVFLWNSKIDKYEKIFN